MVQPDISTYLQPGDTVVIGQATAEPVGLIRSLISAARRVPDLVAFCGYSLTPAWESATDGQLRIRTYVAHGALRKLSNRRALEVVPVHLSALEPHFRAGRLPADVVMLQVGPLRADGTYPLGPNVDYVSAAAQQARVVLIEVNPNMPTTRSFRALPASLVTEAFRTDAPLPGSPSRDPSDVERVVARRVASQVLSGSAIQLGVGPLADAVARNLRHRRNLTVRSGLVGDWLIDLYESGAIKPGPGSSVVGMALGTQRLYDFLDSSDAVVFCPSGQILDPTALGRCDPLVAVNSALEVGLTGEVNAEVIGNRYVGAVGGQVDFFRATRLSRTGLAIVALGSRDKSGQSRIVHTISGPATSLKSDVDLVVTEWGIADLRVASVQERAERLIAIAAPEHRPALMREAAATLREPVCRR